MTRRAAGPTRFVPPVPVVPGLGIGRFAAPLDVFVREVEETTPPDAEPGAFRTYRPGPAAPIKRKAEG